MSSFAKPTNSERENGRGGGREEGRNLKCALCSQLVKYYIKLKTLCSFCREGIKVVENFSAANCFYYWSRTPDCIGSDNMQ